MFKKKKYIVLLGLCILIITILILYFLPIYTLELRTFSSGEVIFQQRIQPGDKFILEYNHSVARTPVWEIFIIDDNYKIILVETDFLDHGAGMPYAPFGQEIFIEEEGKFKIKNMHRIMPDPIYYMVGKNSNNCFYFKDNKINLSYLLGDELLIIENHNINLIMYLLGGIFR
ncbi:MAG TPA: hypothetical protein DEG96_09020 [Candidatus Atribacteria bacterium]|nr:hypothetical protein [Candidatus Atribacteria bacterium]